MVDANGDATRFGYNAVSNLTSPTDAVGNTTAFKFDALDRMPREINSLVHARSYQYDAVDNLPPGAHVRPASRSGESRTGVVAATGTGR